MIRNRYNRITLPSPDKYGKETQKSTRHKLQQHKRKAKRSALSQQMSEVITVNRQRPTGSGQTITIRITRNRSTALERSVINYCGA